MEMSRIKKKRFLAATLVGMAWLHRRQAGDFTTMKENIFVCISPQAYDDAMCACAKTQRPQLEPLKEGPEREKLCMFGRSRMAHIWRPSPLVLHETARCKSSSSFHVSQKVEFCTG